MMNLRSTFLFLICGTLFYISVTAQPIKNRRPNIVFILADDLGYMDLNVYAKKITGVSAKD